MYLPQYFTLEELCHTSVRTSNIPNFEQVCNLSSLCEHILDPLREQLSSPIIVNSGFRCDEVNRLVHGVKNSYHLRGMAADIRCQDKYSVDLFHFIKTHFVFSELGLYPQFVHVAYDAQHLDMDTFVHAQ